MLGLDVLQNNNYFHDRVVIYPLKNYKFIVFSINHFNFNLTIFY